MYRQAALLSHRGRPRDVSCLSLQQQTLQYLECSLLLLVTASSDLPMRTMKLCSVVFGVTLRLLVINTSSSVSRANNKRRRLSAMSVTNLPLSGADVCITLGRRTVDNLRSEARYWSRVAIFAYPTCNSTPLLESHAVGILP